MNLKLIGTLVWLIALVGAGVFVFAESRDNESGTSIESQIVTSQVSEVTSESCLSEECLEVEGLEYPADTLTNEAIQALGSALDDEYKARATYDAVMDEIGPVRPFSMIIRAEEQHISSLKSIYDKYGLDIPEDPYTEVEVASSKAGNCSVGVQAEIDNAALYRDVLLPAVSGYPDITSVFTSLMNASQDKHLPAFEKCAS